ncbi:LysR substrate-binding domain-containing protein [Cupriavidus sp. WGlv3]|uniref:LysR substrate-binding domain-containing protein n=1 Tax=Cupriavidus sp. WGlv3 TaxID=2919924 RepID=UPI002090131D|nr:LysR substrate-binding domain-containing protein [Cupriavidus sp. WGlv3]MCO4865825.1 LysR substrate-binding domain-containing protein [Cupriavidus sp. WGlv3]
MEFRQLKYFVRIVELGSVSRAAADLYTAQPALSQQIAKLEDELKVKLLARSARGVVATEAGEVFYRHARAMLRQADLMKNDVRHAGEHPQGTVSVGLPTSAATILAPRLLAAAARQYPDIQLQITESLSGHLQELVVNGRIEMSLLFERVDGSGAVRESRLGAHLEVRPLLTERLFLMSCEPSGGALPEEISIAEAAKLALILPGKSNITRQIIDEAFEAAGERPVVLAELDSLATIRAVVASGVGSTILSPSLPGGTAGFTVQRIAGAALQRRLSLCTFDIMPLSSAARRIMELICETALTLVDEGAWPGAARIG